MEEVTVTLLNNERDKRIIGYTLKFHVSNNFKILKCIKFLKSSYKHSLQ